MKILWLTHPECDYSAYFLYNGLRQLGVEVVDYPWKAIYHGESCKYPIPWYGEDKMGSSSPPRFHRNWSGVKYNEKDVLGMIKEFDFVVLESPRPIAVETLDRLDRRRGLPPIVLVDGEDYDYIHKEIIDRFVITVSFKREQSYNLKGVYPFPFSSYVVDDERYQFDDSEKELDVFFIAGNTHPQRELVSKVLKKVVKKQGYKGLIGLDREPDKPLIDHDFRFKRSGVRLGLDGYLECIAKAKIGVSVRGFGRDTIRYWEVPSYDTLLFSDDLSAYGLIHPHPFTDGENAVFFNPDCVDLEEKLIFYLENEDVRRKVAEAGHKYLCKWHTNVARARFFVERVQQEVGL